MQLHRYINQGKYKSWEQFRRDRSYFWDIYHPDESLKKILQNAEVGPPSDKPKDPSRQESPVRYHTDKVYDALLECQNDEGKNNSFSPKMSRIVHIQSVSAIFTYTCFIRAFLWLLLASRGHPIRTPLYHGRSCNDKTYHTHTLDLTPDTPGA